jgi:hypothetical protein
MEIHYAELRFGSGNILFVLFVVFVPYVAN